MALLRGTVKWFNNARGFGFLGRDDGGPDVFVHYRAILDPGYKVLREAEPVEFEITETPTGPRAARVVRLSRPLPPPE